MIKLSSAARVPSRYLWCRYSDVMMGYIGYHYGDDPMFAKEFLSEDWMERNSLATSTGFVVAIHSRWVFQYYDDVSFSDYQDRLKRHYDSARLNIGNFEELDSTAFLYDEEYYPVYELGVGRTESLKIISKRSALYSHTRAVLKSMANRSEGI